MSGEKEYSIVIDNGSDTIRAGISGEDAPRSNFPTIVGAPKTRDVMIGHDSSVT